MNARLLSVFFVAACHSTAGDVASLRNIAPPTDALPEEQQPSRHGGTIGSDAPGSESETMAGMPLPREETDAVGSVEPRPSASEGTDAAFVDSGAADASTHAPRFDAGVAPCSKEESRCTEAGDRERCNAVSGEVEPDGTSCALQLFDGYDGYAVYARRSDGAFAAFSDVPMPESMLALVASTRVWSVVPETDPSSLQMPWWIDETRVLRNAVTAEVVENTASAHFSHGLVLAVGEDGSVSVLGTEVQLRGAYVAALGHAENAWLLAADGTLSPGLNAFTLAPRDWLPTLDGAYQKVFALDLDLCGLALDGEVHCASLDGGEWIDRLPVGSFSDMTCNFRTCYVLDQDGDVDCFSPSLECVPHSGPFVDIATSLQLTCGIRPDATVGCWYHNGNEHPPESMPAEYR